MDKELEKLLSSIDKQYGQGSVMLMGSDEAHNIERCSSGSLQLDLALGGGYPLGRITELYGKESGGKTTVALFHIAELQKKYPDKYCAFIDAEYALDTNLAKQYGVNLDKMVISQPDNGEEAFNIVESLARSGKFIAIVVDSVSALVPQAEAESGMEQQSIGLQARMMSKALRKLTSVAGQFNCSIIFINQIRERVNAYGNPETTSGGRALRFHASIRVEVKPGEPIKVKEDRIGHIVSCNVTKNKTAMPYRKASFALIYGEGIDRVAEVGQIAIDVGVVKQGGAWYSITDSEGNIVTKEIDGQQTPLKWQGKEKFFDYLKTDEVLASELEAAIRGQG